MYDKGARVRTPQGCGSVVYRRMKAPTFSEVDCYSVCLDAKKKESETPPFPSYSGTVFPADAVTPE